MPGVSVSGRQDTYCLDCANADDEGAAKALVNGLARKGSLGFLVHTSGSGILCYADIERKVFGEEATKVYDDWDGVEEITSFPDAASHRNVDKVVIGAHTHSPSVKTAIVCPPCIYGPGRGPSNQRSMQLPELARCTLERKEGLQVGAGKARWANVHVHDMSNCFLKLVEAAIEGGGKATWGQEGYYFTENGEHYWGDLSKVVAKAAQKQGLLQSVNVAALSAQETDQLSHHGSVLWGANSRCKAIRARKLLGWSPKERSIEDEASDATAIEARSLGLTTGHAAKVAAA